LLVLVIKGINKWHDEAKDMASFDLANNLIEQTYLIQKEVVHVRGPVHFNYELVQSKIDISIMPQAEAWMNKMLHMHMH
jgi:hypothetical protein